MDDQQFLVLNNALEIGVLDKSLYCCDSAVFTLTPAIEKRTSEGLFRKVENFIKEFY